jgi:hypothetical protein
MTEAAADGGVADAGTSTVDAPNMRRKRTRDKVRLLSLNSLDGRTAAARVARGLVAELESDLGGADQLTAATREVVQRAALAAVMLRNMEADWLAGRGIDVPSYTTLANTQSRLLKLIGLERRSRDVSTLADYLASKAASEPA